MRKEPAIILALFLFLTSTAVAAPNNEKRNEHSQNNNKNKQQEVLPLVDEVTVSPTEAVTITVSPTLSVSPTAQVSPTTAWKNHGQYVSSVAKQHLGGQTTSEAARSDIGKKNKTVTPSVSPSVSPTVTVTEAPTPTVTTTVTPPITSEVETASFSLFPDFGRLWKNLVRFFSFGQP